MSQLESYTPASAQAIMLQGTVPAASSIAAGEALLGQIDAQRAANPPQVDYDIAALADMGQISPRQKEALAAAPNKDTYNYIYDKNAFIAQHGQEALRNIDSEVSKRIIPDPIDTRSGVETLLDYGLGVGQGIFQGVAGAAAVATIPGSKISNSIANAANKVTKWSTENLGSSFINQAQKSSAAKQAGRSALSRLQWEIDKANGDNDFYAGLKQFGRDALQASKDLLNDPGAFEQAATNALGSLAVAGPLSRGVSALGSALAKNAVKGSLASRVGGRLITSEGRSLAERAIGNEGLTNAILEMGGSVQGAIAAVNALSADQLMANPEFAQKVRENMAKGMSAETAFNEAKEELASSVARFAAGITAPIAAYTGGVADKIIRSPFKLTNGSMNPLNWGKEIAERAAKEGTEEFLQGFQKMGENIGMKANGFDTHLWEGVGEEAATGALAGAFSGGAGPIVGTAGTAAKLAAAVPVAGAKVLYDHTDFGKSRNYKNDLETLRSSISDIDASNLSDDAKKLYKDTLNRSNIDKFDITDADNTTKIENQLGRSLSDSTKSLYDNSKSLFDNILKMKRAAEKAEKKGDIAASTDILNDAKALLDIAASDTDKGQILLSAQQQLLHAKQAYDNNVNPSSNQLKGALEIYKIISSDQSAGSDSIAKVEEQIKKMYPDIEENQVTPSAIAYIMAYRALNEKNKTGKSAFELSNELTPVLDKGIKASRNLVKGYLSEAQEEITEMTKDLEDTYGTAASRNAPFLHNPTGSSQNLKKSLDWIDKTLNSNSTLNEKQTAIDTIDKIAKDTSLSPERREYLNYARAVAQAQIEATKGLATNPNLNKVTADNREKWSELFQEEDSASPSINRLANEIASAKDKTAPYSKIRTLAQQAHNQYEALGAALKSLATAKGNAKEASISYHDPVDKRTKVLSIDRDSPEDILALEHTLYARYKAYEALLKEVHKAHPELNGTMPSEISQRILPESMTRKQLKKDKKFADAIKKISFKQAYDMNETSPVEMAKESSDALKNLNTDEEPEETEKVETKKQKKDKEEKEEQKEIQEEKEDRKNAIEITKQNVASLLGDETELYKFFAAFYVGDYHTSFAKDSGPIEEQIGLHRDNYFYIYNEDAGWLKIHKNIFDAWLKGQTKEYLEYLNKLKSEQQSETEPQEEKNTNTNNQSSDTKQENTQIAPHVQKLLQQNPTLQGLPQNVLDALAFQHGISIEQFYPHWPAIGQTYKYSEFCSIKRLSLTSVEITNSKNNTKSIYTLPGSAPTTFDGKSFDEWNQDEEFVKKYGKIVDKGYSANGSEYAITDKDYTRRVKMYDSRTLGKDSGLDTKWNLNVRPLFSGPLSEFINDLFKNDFGGFDDLSIYLNDKREVFIHNEKTDITEPLTYRKLLNRYYAEDEREKGKNVYEVYKKEAAKLGKTYPDYETFLDTQVSFITSSVTPIRQEMNYGKNTELFYPFEMGRVVKVEKNNQTFYELRSFHPSSGIRYLESAHTSSSSSSSLMSAIKLTPEQKAALKKERAKQSVETLRTFINTWNQKDVVIIDTETTGTNTESDEVVQIAATRYSKGKQVGKPRYWFIKISDAKHVIPEYFGERKNEFKEIYDNTPEDQKVEFKQAYEELLEFAKDADLAGHNLLGFDMPILQANANSKINEEAGQRIYDEHLGWDTLDLLIKLDSSWYGHRSLDELRGITDKGLNLQKYSEGGVAHDAREDVKTTFGLIKYILQQWKNKASQEAKLAEREASDNVSDAQNIEQIERTSEEELKLIQKNLEDSPFGLSGSDLIEVRYTNNGQAIQLRGKGNKIFAHKRAGRWFYVPEKTSIGQEIQDSKSIEWLEKAANTLPSENRNNSKKLAKVYQISPENIGHVQKYQGDGSYVFFDKDGDIVVTRSPIGQWLWWDSVDKRWAIADPKQVKILEDIFDRYKNQEDGKGKVTVITGKRFGRGLRQSLSDTYNFNNVTINSVSGKGNIVLNEMPDEGEARSGYAIQINASGAIGYGQESWNWDSIAPNAKINWFTTKNDRDTKTVKKILASLATAIFHQFNDAIPDNWLNIFEELVGFLNNNEEALKENLTFKIDEKDPYGFRGTLSLYGTPIAYVHKQGNRYTYFTNSSEENLNGIEHGVILGNFIGALMRAANPEEFKNVGKNGIALTEEQEAKLLEAEAENIKAGTSVDSISLNFIESNQNFLDTLLTVHSNDPDLSPGKILRRAKKILKEHGITFFGSNTEINTQALQKALQGKKAFEDWLKTLPKENAKTRLEKLKTNPEKFWEETLVPLIDAIYPRQDGISFILFDSEEGQAIIQKISTKLVNFGNNSITSVKLQQIYLTSLLNTHAEVVANTNDHTILYESERMPELFDSMDETKALQNMPASLKDSFKQLFDGLIEDNLLNRLNNPFEDLRTLFTNIDTWLKETNNDLKQVKERIAKFFSKDGSITINLRITQLMENLFAVDENGNYANLEAMKNLFSDDPEKSLLAYLHDKFIDSLASDVNDKKKNFLLEMLSDEDKAALHLTDANHNGNALYLVRDGENLGINENMLQRALLATVSAYLTMFRERNVQKDKQSLDIPEFVSDQLLKEGIISEIGSDVETAQHIFIQLQNHLKDFLGFKNAPGVEILAQQRVLAAMAQSMFSIMVDSGLVTVYTVDMYKSSKSSSSVNGYNITQRSKNMDAVEWDSTELGSHYSANANEQKHTINFISLNDPNDKRDSKGTLKDQKLHDLAGSMSSVLAFVLQNMILQRVNDNVFFGQEALEQSQAEHYDKNGKLIPMRFQHMGEKATLESTLNALELEKIPLYLNSNFAAFILNASEEDLLEFFDAAFDEDFARKHLNSSASQSQKGKYIGVRTQIRDGLDLLRQFKAYVLAHQGEKIDLATAPVFFKRGITSMGRYMMLGGANTQSSKLLRELFINKEDPSQSYDLTSESQYSFLLRAIAAGLGGKVNRIIGGVRGANPALIAEIKKKLGEDFFKSKDWETFFKAVQKGDFNIAPASELNQKEETNPAVKALLNFLKAKKINTFLGINAAIELARLMTALKIDNIDQLVNTPMADTAPAEYFVNMYIENDGITSGASHLFHLLTTTDFSPAQIRMMAATGMSFFSSEEDEYASSFAEMRAFAGDDAYDRTSKHVTSWFHRVFHGNENDSVTLVQAANSLGMTDMGNPLMFPFLNENGELGEERPIEITDLVKNILIAVQQCYLGVSVKGAEPGEEISIDRLINGALEEINFERDFSKDSVIMFTYQAGAKAMSDYILNLMLTKYYSLQSQYNTLKIANENDPQLPALEKQITQIGQAFWQASAAVINGSSYAETAIHPTFGLEFNYYSQSKYYFIPEKDENGLYDTRFALPIGAVRALSSNMQHLLIKPMIKGIEEEVYDEETINNKRLLTGIHNFMGNVYEQIEAYYIAQTMKLARKNNHTLSQDDFDKIRGLISKLKPVIHETLKDFKIKMSEQKDGDPNQKDILIKQLNAQLYTVVETAAANLLKSDYGHLISQEEVESILKSGSSLFERRGLPSVDVEMNVRTHQANGVACLLQMIQGFAEAGIIAAAAQQGFQISDQYDGVNVALGKNTQFVTQFNNGAAANLWLDLDLFEITNNSFKDFLDTLNSDEEVGYKTILKAMLEAKHVRNYPKDTDEVSHKRRSGELYYQLSDAGDITYKNFGAPTGLDLQLSGSQERFAKTLYDLAKNMGMAFVNGMSYSTFKLCLFNCSTDPNIEEESERNEIAEKLNEWKKQKKDRNLESVLPLILLEINRAMVNRSVKLKQRKKALRHLGDIWVDQLGGLGKAYREVMQKIPGVKSDFDIKKKIAEARFKIKNAPNNAEQIWNDLAEEISDELNNIMRQISTDEDRIKMSLASEIEEFTQKYNQLLVEAKVAELEKKQEEDFYGSTDTQKNLKSLHEFAKNRMSLVQEVNDRIEELNEEMKKEKEANKGKKTQRFYQLKDELDKQKELKAQYNYVFALIQRLASSKNDMLKNVPIIVINTQDANLEETIRKVINENYKLPEEQKEDYIKEVLAETKKDKSWYGLTTWSSGSNGTSAAIFVNISMLDEVCKREGITAKEYLPYVLQHEIMHVSFDRIIDQYAEPGSNGMDISASLRSRNPIAYRMLKNVADIYNALPEQLEDIATNENDPQHELAQSALELLKGLKLKYADNPKQALKEFVAYVMSYNALNRILQQRLHNFSQVFNFNSTLEETAKTIKEVKEEALDASVQKNTKVGSFSKLIQKLADAVKAFIHYFFSTYAAFRPNEKKNQKFFESALANLSWSLYSLSGTTTFTEQKNYKGSINSTSSAMSNIVSQTWQKMKKGWDIKRSKRSIQYKERNNAEIEKTTATFMANNIEDITYLSNIVTSLQVDNIISSQDISVFRDNLKKVWQSILLSPYEEESQKMLNRMADVAKEIIDYIKPDIFYTSENPSEQEKAEANSKLDFLLDAQHSPIIPEISEISVALPIILTLAQTNSKLMEKLTKVTPAKNEFEKEGVHMFDDFLRVQGAKFDAWLTKLLTNNAANKSLQMLVQSIDNQIVTIFDKAAENMIDINSKITNIEEKVAAGLENATENTGIPIFNQNNRDRLVRKFKSWMNKTPDSYGREFLKKIANTMLGPDTKDMPLHQLIKYMKANIDQIRQSYRTNIPKSIRKMFAKAKLTKAHWESLTRSLAKTTLYTFARFSPDLMHKLPELLSKNSAELSASISEYEESLAKAFAKLRISQKDTKTILAKTEQLGRYMATNEAGDMLQKNVFAVYYINTNRIPSTEVENAMSVLVSLYALKYLNSEDKSTLVHVLNSNKKGVHDLLRILATTMEQEDAKLSILEESIQNNKAVDNPSYVQYLRTKLNAYQNYIPALSIPKAQLIIAKDSEADRLRGFGYKRKGSYDNKLGFEGSESYGYYYNTVPELADFTEGVIKVTSDTYKGIYTNTGTSIEGVDSSSENLITDTKRIAKIMQAQQQTKNGDYLLPVYDIKNGVLSVVAFEHAYNKQQQMAFYKNYQLPDMIGVLQGRQVEEMAVNIFNYRGAQQIFDLYDPKRHGEYIDITDYEHLNPIQKNAVSKIPHEVFAYMRELFKDAGYGDHIYIRKDLWDDAIGYRKFSIAEAFYPERSDYNQTFLKNVEKTLHFFFGDQAFRIAVRGEQAIQGVANWAKTNIIVRSVKVCVINGVSNIYHLHAKGVSFGEMTRMLPKIYKDCETYANSFKKLRDLDVQIAAAETDEERKALLRKKNQEEEYIHSLSIYPIITEYSIIQDLARSSEDLALVRGQYGEWMQEYVVNHLPDTLVNAGRYLFMTKDTAIFEGLEKAVQYGDFIAKAIYYHHLVRTGKNTQERAKQIIQNEFVDYDRNPGRTRNYLESIMMYWFGNFILGIMPVAESLLRNNPVRAMINLTGTLPGSSNNVLMDSFLGKLIRGMGFSNVGLGYFSLAWDAIPIWWLFALL